MTLLVPTFALPRAPADLPIDLHRPRDAPLPRHQIGGIRSFGAGLSPGHCRRARTRPVSCYALFEGWLLLSQPPGCLGARTSFATEPALRDLSRRSGLLPSRRWSLAPTASLGRAARGIRGLVGVGSLAAPRPASALPPPAGPCRLPLKAFRGEPAISEFGWHFTSTHSSSHDFEPSPGSGLQPGLAGLRPGHG